jgi:hypothetical protein
MRDQNCDAFPGISRPLCRQHLFRDLEDAAGSYADAIWPGRRISSFRVSRLS